MVGRWLKICGLVEVLRRSHSKLDFVANLTWNSQRKENKLK